MKRIILPLLAALALPTAVNAENWIDVANYYEGLGKGRRYIDASSIYKRGDWIYAYFKVGSRKISYRKTRHRFQLKVNCKKGIINDDTTTPYIQSKRLGDGYWKLRFFPTEKSRNPQLDGVYNFLCKSSPNEANKMPPPTSAQIEVLKELDSPGYFPEKIDNFKTAVLYFKRAKKKAEDGDHSGSIYDLSKVIESNQLSKGNLVIAYHNRGVEKNHLKDYSGAISDFSKAIDINPRYADAYYRRGFAKYHLKDYSGAISDFSKAIDINPRYADAYYRRGFLKYDLKDHSGAISDFSKAIDINPRYYNAYFVRGLIKYLVNKDTVGSCSDMRTAARLGHQEAKKIVERDCD